jgi:hypothetical protein
MLPSLQSLQHLTDIVESNWPYRVNIKSSVSWSSLGLLLHEYRVVAVLRGQ